MSASTIPTAAGTGGGILLDAGTNELEMLVITLGGQNYGVNVAKVREVLDSVQPTKIPQTHEAVEGTFRIRDEVVPLVNLARVLDFDSADCQVGDDDRILIMEFNQQRVAFRVQGVNRILRMSWKDIRPMPRIGSASIPVTGVAVVEGALVQMLDFESITMKIGMIREIPRCQPQSPDHKTDRHDVPIVFADDSTMIRTMIADALSEAGYQNVRGFSDGDEAWNYLQGLSGTADTNAPHEGVAVVITDVEMPRMDGLHLTHRIRQHTALRNVPVILFSSIVSRDNLKKGEQVGATAQVAKPHYDELMDKLDGLIRELAVA